MPLFRSHRGTLADSLLTTVVIKNIHELEHHIRSMAVIPIIEPFKLIIKPYPYIGDNFDKRCGWFTHIVMFENLEGILGFLSEALD